MPEHCPIEPMDDALVAERRGRGVRDLGEAYRSGALSPLDVLAEQQALIDRAQPAVNAFVFRPPPEELRQAARDSERRWREAAPLGAFDGVPVTIKDMVWTRGWPTLAGSRAVDAAQAWDEDAPCVARLREQGAIILGKTATSEFGWKAVTDTPRFGITRNPLNLALTPGGSSGGAAASLACGIGSAAVGTDGAGSVRIPAAFCGLVGFKATAGRIPAYPPSSLWRMGHVGPMARSVADVTALFEVMAQPDRRDWSGLPPLPARDSEPRLTRLDGLRVAYSPTLGYAEVEPAIARAVEDAVAALGAAGAQVTLVEQPFPDPTASMWTLYSAGIAHAMDRLDDAQHALLDEGLEEAAEQGRRVSRSDYMAAVDVQVALTRMSRQFEAHHDVLVTPSTAVQPFPVGLSSPPGHDPVRWLSWAPFAFPFNMTGQPAISVPCGRDEAGLPIGLQIVGGLYDDRRLLDVAHLFEACSPYRPAGSR